MKNNKIPLILLGITGVVIAYLLAQIIGVDPNFSVPVSDPTVVSLGAIFLTGLLIGGLTCIAVQGGLLAATIAQREEEKLEEKSNSNGTILPISSFLIAKLISYTILGFLLGLLGSLMQLSLTIQAILQLTVAIFMVGVALNLLNVHPVFRYFIIQPPRFLTRMVHKKSKSKSIFAPAILGAFTVFIPCGTTQAMMALAVASGSAIMGSAILFAFILGTTPLFFLLGFFTAKLGDVFQKRFLKFAAFAIILLAIYNADVSLALLGSNVTLRNLFASASVEDLKKDTAAVSDATIFIDNNGYSPANLTVKAGSSVTLNIVNRSGGGCAQAFTLPRYNIQKIVPVGSSDKISFTAPDEPGELAFMCSMGMYRGVIKVI